MPGSVVHGSSGSNKSAHWKPSAKGSYSSATVGAWPNTHMISYMLFICLFLGVCDEFSALYLRVFTGAEGVKVQKIFEDSGQHSAQPWLSP